MNRLIRYIWIVFVPGTLIILRTVRLPITQTHPAKIMFAIVTLHVITTSIFLYTNVTLWAVFGIGTNVVCRLTIVRAFRYPLFDRLAISRRMIIRSTLKTKRRFTRNACRLLRRYVLTANYNRAIRARTKSEFGVGFHVILECKLLVFVTQCGTCQ